jgi:hypothetical protein
MKWAEMVLRLIVRRRDNPDAVRESVPPQLSA